MPGRSSGTACHRIGSNLEGAQVEIAGRARGAPSRIFALGGDHLDLRRDHPVAERGHPHLEAVSELQALGEILAQIEAQPHIVQIDERQQRHAG